MRAIIALLIVTGTAAPAPAQSVPPAGQAGGLVLSGQSQFIVELEDEGLDVFYLLQIANGGQTAVEREPLVFDLPAGARGATLLEGSSPLAKIEGPRLVVSGPFPPGTTVVQAAYRMPYGGDALTVEQRLPARLEFLSLAAQKVGAMHLTSPQMSNHGETVSNGRTYLVASGPAIQAGDALTFTITGLPHRAVWPRVTAVAAAVVVLLVGAWSSVSVGDRASAAAARRRTLQQRRDRLFADLIRLEQDHRAGALDDQRHALRRRDLVAELERLYGDLDDGLVA